MIQRRCLHRRTLIAENSFKGTDIFQLVDEITIKLKHDLEVPVRHIEEAKDLPVQEIEAQLEPPFDKFISLGYLGIYLELEDADNAEKAIEGVKLCIKNLGLEELRSSIFYVQGRIHGIKGEFEQAIIMYQKALELQPTDSKYK